MASLEIKFGVLIGMVVSFVIFFPMFDWFLGACFYEQGCEQENLKILGIFTLACLVGCLAGWITARVCAALLKRLQQRKGL